MGEREPITIEAIKGKKNVLKDKICILLREFEKDTGVLVESNLHLSRTANMMSGNGEIYDIELNVKI